MDRVVSLVVITLLQLCRGNIPNALPEWYAANLINDPNYSPKPLTEIFSTVRVFPSSSDATTPWSTTTSAPPATEPTTRNVQTQGPEIPISRQPPPAMSQITNPPQNRESPAIIWPVPQTTTQAPQTIPTDPPILSTTPIWNVNQPNWLQNQPNLGPGVWNGNNWPQNQQNIQPYLPIMVSQSTNPPTSNRPCDNPTSSQASIVSNVPQTQDPSAATQASGPPRPILTISVRRKGHKTNVLINPSTTPSTTTTRKPTTTRRKRNNYEVCLESCKNTKEPICSSPRGATPINPDNLKGFASTCHMTCQNNFRNQKYEKVADGRCGKLRTRIRPVGQDKLNRDELNKAQYTVVHNGQETVIEFSELGRSA